MHSKCEYAYAADVCLCVRLCSLYAAANLELSGSSVDYIPSFWSLALYLSDPWDPVVPLLIMKWPK